MEAQRDLVEVVGKFEPRIVRMDGKAGGKRGKGRKGRRR
jgi:hypothetical protein